MTFLALSIEGHFALSFYKTLATKGLIAIEKTTVSRTQISF